jgi:hypothetical protein
METQVDRIERKLDELLGKLDELLARKKRSPTVKQVLVKPDFVGSQAWESFLQHRKQKKVPITETAYKMMLRKLTDWHKAKHDVNAILRQSVENGWTGLFEIKNNDRQSTLKPEHISATYKQFDPSAPTDKHLDSFDPYADLK